TGIIRTKNRPSVSSTTRGGKASSVRAPTAANGTPVIEQTAQARQSTPRYHTMMRERRAINAANAMMGTAGSGPKAETSTGSIMTDEPNPTMPLIVPASNPTSSTSRNSKGAGGQKVVTQHRQSMSDRGPVKDVLRDTFSQRSLVYM